MSKVIHVHLIGKHRDYYFGSISAIYTLLTPEDVGVTKSYLLHAGLAGGGTVFTQKAIIKQAFIIKCPRTTSDTL